MGSDLGAVLDTSSSFIDDAIICTGQTGSEKEGKGYE